MSKYFDGDKLSGYEDSPITYVYGGNLEECHKVIADLEAKLAESEKQIQAYEEIVEQKDKEISFANRDKTCIVKQLNDPKAYVLLEDYKELKQQLDEKDKEILDVKNWWSYQYNGEIERHNQDKISFAVEKLEKVRKTIKNLHSQKNCKIGNSYIQKKDKSYNKYIVELDILENLLEIFDNQIKQLKEEK